MGPNGETQLVADPTQSNTKKMETKTTKLKAEAAKLTEMESRRWKRNLYNDTSEGSLLHCVQMAQIYPDGKTFVDMKMLTDPSTVLANFDALKERKSDPAVLKAFVESHFALENQMEAHTPLDWVEHPKLLSKVNDPTYSEFASELNGTWSVLCRSVSPAVAVHPERYSLVHLPHPAVVPGGRFREIYYWDSFWIMRGLLLCEMYETAKGVLLNFIHFLELYGMVPNGGRTYYTNRSQPPLLIQMVHEYVEETGDYQFVVDNMHHLETEFRYWQREHSIEVQHNGETHTMFRFNCVDLGPRPESYREDFELVEAHAHTEETQTEMYKEMKTGAETGWDYSSRWMIVTDADEDSNPGLQHTRPSKILPVDLNSFLEKNARILSAFARDILDDEDAAAEHATVADDLRAAINSVLWSEEDGSWFDYDLHHGRLNKSYYPSNYVPLFTGSGVSEKQVIAAVASLSTQGVFPGGLPTSTTTTGQQWDFPNCWPPLEHMVVVGLQRTELPEAKELAFKIAEVRVRGAYVNHLTKGHMFEKYDATSLKRIGGGGEYDVQVGFGWTNGVVLDFLSMYGDRLVAQPDIDQRKSVTSRQM